jgi:hypothetical protein
MPIDDILATLEGVPEHMIKEPLELKFKIPETLEELQEMYSDKFNIYNDIMDKDWICIRFLQQNYKNIEGEGSYKLEYGFNIKVSNLLANCRCIHLYDEDDFPRQYVYKNKHDFYDYFVENSYEISDKDNLEKWFDKSEEFFLNEIPELEEFVKQYAN